MCHPCFLAHERVPTIDFHPVLVREIEYIQDEHDTWMLGDAADTEPVAADTPARSPSPTPMQETPGTPHTPGGGVVMTSVGETPAPSREFVAQPRVLF